MHGAGALIERHVFASSPIESRSRNGCRKIALSSFVPGKRARTVLSQPSASADLRQQSFRNDRDASRRIYGDVVEFRMKTDRQDSLEWSRA